MGQGFMAAVCTGFAVMAIGRSLVDWKGQAYGLFVVEFAAGWLFVLAALIAVFS